MSSNKAATGGRIAALEAEVERLQNVLRITVEAPRLTGMETLAADRDRLAAENAALREAMPDPVTLAGMADALSTDGRYDWADWARGTAGLIQDALSAPATPAEAEAGTGGSGDTQRLAWLASELAMDWEIGGVDVAGLACAHAEDDGRDEPTDADVLAALRRAIDTAMAPDKEPTS